MREPTEFTVSGVQYMATPMNAFEQWDVTRRLLPVVGGAAEAIARVAKTMRVGGVEAAKGEASNVLGELLEHDVSEVIEPMMKAFAGMSDVDSQFIIDRCLTHVKRFEAGVWAPLMPQPKALAFQLSMVEMLGVVWKVIEANVLSFS